MCVQSVCKHVSFQRLSLRPAVVSLLRLTKGYVPYRFDGVYSLPLFLSYCQASGNGSSVRFSYFSFK